MKKLSFILIVLYLTALSVSAKKKVKPQEFNLESVKTEMSIDSVVALFSFPMVSIGDVSISSESESKKRKTAVANDSVVMKGVTKKQLVDFFVQNVVYPLELKQKAAEEYLKVCFNIDKEGNIKNPKVLNSKFPEMEQEALRVVGKIPFFTTDSVEVKSKKEKKKIQDSESTIEISISFRLLKL